MSTTMTERKADETAVSIRDLVLCVDSMVGVGLLNFKGKSVTIDECSN